MSTDIDRRLHLAAHVRAVGHPLAAAVISGGITITAAGGELLPDELTEDQAVGALELGEPVVIRPQA